MSDSTVPPVPKSATGGYIAAGVVMLLAMGGLIVWKLGDPGVEVEVQESGFAPAPSQQAEMVLDAAPPPPPPEEEVTAEPAPTEQKKAPVASSGSSGCSGACQGTLGAEGTSALRAKGGQARSCYNRALGQNSALAGKLNLQVRIAPSGNVCSVQVTEDTLGDPGVSSCVTQMFRTGKFPAPQGGCVDAAVPLNFVSSG